MDTLECFLVSEKESEAGIPISNMRRGCLDDTSYAIQLEYLNGTDSRSIQRMQLPGNN